VPVPVLALWPICICSRAGIAAGTLAPTGPLPGAAYDNEITCAALHLASGRALMDVYGFNKGRQLMSHPAVHF
jgi:hypothetical protein